MRFLTGLRWTLVSIPAVLGLIGILYLPDGPGWLNPLLAVSWVAGAITIGRRVPRARRYWVPLVAGALAWLPYLGVSARNDRDWVVEQARAPVAEFHGDNVTIRNFRAAAWRSADDFDLDWTECTVDLSSIRTVDYVVEPFSSWRGLAHTFLTFGFADGRHVAISVEARREAGEAYSPIKGLLRHYELIYVIGEERDLIGLRANIRRDPVHVYPIATPPELVRSLFVSMLTRANELAAQPDFYNSLSNTCTSAVLRHVNAVRTNKISGGWRILFPGFSDAIAWEIGFTDFTGTLEEARARFLINDRSAFDPALDDAGWSRQIPHAAAGRTVPVKVRVYYALGFAALASASSFSRASSSLRRST